MKREAVEEDLDIHPLKWPLKSSMVTSEADEVDANGCVSGGRRRRAIVANFCAWPFGIRLPPPSRQPSFSSTPTAAVNSEGMNTTEWNLTGGRRDFIQQLPKGYGSGCNQMTLLAFSLGFGPLPDLNLEF